MQRNDYNTLRSERRALLYHWEQAWASLYLIIVGHATQHKPPLGPTCQWNFHSWFDDRSIQTIARPCCLPKECRGTASMQQIRRVEVMLIGARALCKLCTHPKQPKKVRVPVHPIPSSPTSTLVSSETAILFTNSQSAVLHQPKTMHLSTLVWHPGIHRSSSA